MLIWTPVSNLHCLGLGIGFLSGMLGEWEHFLYVVKIAFFGWAFHYCKFAPVLLVSPVLINT